MFQIIRNMILLILTVFVNGLMVQCQYSCSRLSYCICEEDADTIRVSCRVRKQLNTLPALFEDIDYKPIRYLAVRSCFEVSLEQHIFTNASIEHLHFFCPFQQLDDRSLLGVKNLYRLMMENTKFEIIPLAIAKLSNLRFLQICYGQLFEIGNELHNMTVLRGLRLNKNFIEIISRDAFIFNVNLQYVDISHNRIKILYPGTFRHCQAIRYFNAGYNNIDTVEGIPRVENIWSMTLRGNNLNSLGNLFQTHMDVKVIDVRSNNFLNHLSDGTFSNKLLSLSTLKMDGCKISILPPRLLKPLSSLEKINLSYNRLLILPEGFFHNLRKLKEVLLSNNKLVTLSNIFMKNPDLELVNLHNNNIENIGNAFQHTPSLKKINLRRNKIKELREEDFKFCSSLENLTIAGNNIRQLDRRVFRHMKLKNLVLSSNGIAYLNESLQNLPYLTALSLNDNSLKQIEGEDLLNTNNLAFLDLARNHLTTVNKTFKQLKNLQHLRLENNKLKTLPRASFSGIENLRILEVATNRWVCDCRLVWLRDLYINKTIMDDGKSLYCNKPKDFQGRRLVDLSDEELLIVRWTEGCPKPCNCTCVDIDGEFTVKVDCSDRHLPKAPTEFPEMTRELSLENNLITSFDFKRNSLMHLKILNLEKNELNFLDFPVPPSVETLRLADNSINRFFETPPSSVSRWTLSENPWACDCSTLEFRKWMFLHKNKISDINEVRCGDGNSQEFLNNRIIVDLSEVDLCPSIINTYVVTSISVLKLEQKPPFYKIFEPRRDMLAGEMFQFEKEMEESMKSKRVIILLSEHYIQDNFLMKVFKTAFTSSLEEKNFRLILIVVGDLPNLSDMDQSLKAAIESTRCLQFSQKLFKEMLRFAMPKTSLTQKI